MELNTELFLKKYLLPKGWRLTKNTDYKLHCPLAKTGFKIDFLAKNPLFTKQALAKAIGFKNQPLKVFDVTGGWLKDAFLMASMGCQVKAIEWHPFVFHFAKASLETFYQQNKLSSSPPSCQSQRASRIFHFQNLKLSGSLELLFGNSIDYLNSLKNYKDYPDVIFIDPMFEGRKKSTSKKDLRILQELIQFHKQKDNTQGDNKHRLFKSALSKAKKRVVVKRHKLDKALSPEILQCFKGQSVCYDVFAVG